MRRQVSTADCGVHRAVHGASPRVPSSVLLTWCLGTIAQRWVMLDLKVLFLLMGVGVGAIATTLLSLPTVGSDAAAPTAPQVLSAPPAVQPSLSTSEVYGGVDRPRWSAH